jgi:hypothetical protein
MAGQEVKDLANIDPEFEAVCSHHIGAAKMNINSSSST